MSYENIMKDAAVKAFMDDPELAKVAYCYLDAIQSGRIKRTYTDVIVQSDGRHHPIDYIEAYWFARIHSAIGDGRIVFVSLDVETPPLRDHNTTDNQSIIDAAHLPVKISFAPLRGNAGNEGDGVFSWDTPLEVHNHNGESIIIPPGSAPLEVGTTCATTTFRHLTTGANAVARWPYGSNKIWLLVRLPASRTGAAE